MEITNKKIMVLGGYGEVGFAICRRLLPDRPKELIITSLREEEALAAVEKLRTDFPTMTTLTPVHGNLFVRSALKDIPREVILSTSRYERWLVEDTMEELNEEILTSSTLFRTISEHRPDVMVDCINTATALAYQNVYESYRSSPLPSNRRTRLKGSSKVSTGSSRPSPPLPSFDTFKFFMSPCAGVAPSFI